MRKGIFGKRVIIYSAAALFLCTLIISSFFFYYSISKDLPFKTGSSSHANIEVSSISNNVNMESSSSKATTTSQNSSDETFTDSVFLGDQLTCGIGTYNVVKTKGVFSVNMVNMRYNLNGTDIHINNQTTPLPEAIAQLCPSRIYVMLGIDYISSFSKSVYIQKYSNIISQVQNKSPNAKIYIQSLLPVTDTFESSHRISNTKIDDYNRELNAYCNANGYRYVDVASVFKLSNGKMSSNDAPDGINLTSSAYSKWLDYLAHHI